MGADQTEKARSTLICPTVNQAVGAASFQMQTPIKRFSANFVRVQSSQTFRQLDHPLLVKGSSRLSKNVLGCLGEPVGRRCMEREERWWQMRRRMAKMQLDKELEENGRELTGAELKRVRHCPVG